jgi:polyisoprenoid-binding protein YceI
MKPVLTACILAALVAAPAFAADQKTPPAAEAPVPAGAYTLDKSHASLVFTVNHLGFSHYTAQPAASRIEATIDANSLELPTPPAGFTDTLKGPQWLDTAKHPTITFTSTTVEPTGKNTARVTGDFSLHGVTKPVVLEATFNGGYAGHPMDPHARIGFSAKGSFKRSDFGIAYGVPAPGTTMGVGDEVTVMIEAEFSGPPLAK